MDWEVNWEVNWEAAAGSGRRRTDGGERRGDGSAGGSYRTRPHREPPEEEEEVKQVMTQGAGLLTAVLTLRKKPEMRARLILVQLSWQPKAGGETGSSILCMTSRSSALMTPASRSAAWLRKAALHHASSSLSVGTTEGRHETETLGQRTWRPAGRTLQEGVVDVDEGQVIALRVQQGAPGGDGSFLSAGIRGQEAGRSWNRNGPVRDGRTDGRFSPQ